MLIYLHGFNSSPSSRKACQLGERMRILGLEAQFACPALPHLPQAAIGAIETTMARHVNGGICLVGSSLGGFYATHLAEKHGVRAVLVNPAITPHVGLRAYLGAQQNLHTAERYELTPAHLQQWAALCPERITVERYLLLVETGDELLDYRLAMQRYAGARQRVVEGGDHTFQSFVDFIPEILAFGGLGEARPV
ncbi:MAG: esterase [Burkholderiales bacterium]|nr:esterase [Burkholderiales bacterium]